ncbi:ribonuclease T [Paracoccus sediminis]|uniref:Ribonuclease T n=1 Tax=Paracoccus sediminis TaxID=1214787 RepID=A0A238X3Z8_9RHOB|nr:ribonuclease T2 [Paracoccus sediminis]TBN49058.1 ribonuclease T [Paracoccus sediminis]SNR53745.1 ribonuclease T2 [Paracoccus sediminis]
MRALSVIPLLLSVWPAAAPAQDMAGDFDYYVLTLSWSPSWCRATGDARDADECERGSGLDFVVHGLWPQYEQGYPEYCDTDERDPSRRETQAMADLMAPGLALHQWKKHGRCSGLSAAGYYDAMREAADRIAVPVLFDGLSRDIALPPAVVEDAFLEANPDLTFDGTTVTCQGDALREVRICLTRDLDPRRCAPDVRRDCSRPRVLMERVR